MPFKISTEFGAKPVITGADGNIIATVGTPFTEREEDARVARLLAAAPKMLAALDACITSGGAACFSDMRSHPERMQTRLYAVSATARAAIAEAKGY